MWIFRLVLPLLGIVVCGRILIKEWRQPKAWKQMKRSSD